MNNYDGLPELIPSDIDMSIAPELFRRLDSFMCDFAQSFEARIVQKLWHGNMKCAYILATGPADAREFVQLDFFTAFSTKSCPTLITHIDLVSGRRPLRNFYIPRPEIEMVFTIMRRLFKDDWSVRHCTRIAELSRRIQNADWLTKQYEWMRPTVEAAIKGDLDTVSRRRAQDWAQLRSTAASGLTLSERIANILLQIRRIALRLRDETGQLIILAGPRNSIGSVAFGALELVFHRMVFIEQATSVRLLGKLVLLKRRKGLIIVLADHDQPKGRKLAMRLGRLGLVDQVLKRVADTCGPWIGIRTSVFSNDSEAIEAIVSVQAAKTARAIARGWTQTSSFSK